MPSTSAPFGFIPTRHLGGGVVRPRALVGGIASGYGTTIYKGQPVIRNTNGTLVVGTAAADLGGIFAGVEYNDSNGIFTKSTYWPASTTATDIVAYFFDDPDIEYEVQSDATLAATAVGDQADVSNVSNGSTATGLSAATLGTLVGAGVQGQFRIQGLSPDADNAWGDNFVKVRVTIARLQFISNKVAV